MDNSILTTITKTQIEKTIAAPAINSGAFGDETRKIGCNFVSCIKYEPKTELNGIFLFNLIGKAFNLFITTIEMDLNGLFLIVDGICYYYFYF